MVPAIDEMTDSWRHHVFCHGGNKLSHKTSWRVVIVNLPNPKGCFHYFKLSAETSLTKLTMILWGNFKIGH